MEIFPNSSGTSPQMKPEERRKTQRTGVKAEPNSWRNISGITFDSQIQRAETNKRGGAGVPQIINHERRKPQEENPNSPINMLKNTSGTQQAKLDQSKIWYRVINSSSMAKNGRTATGKPIIYTTHGLISFCNLFSC